jgi:hypothetical protein
MLIIGCDFHTRYQQIAMANDETGELLVEQRRVARTLTLKVNLGAPSSVFEGGDFDFFGSFPP